MVKKIKINKCGDKKLEKEKTIKNSPDVLYSCIFRGSELRNNFLLPKCVQAKRNTSQEREAKKKKCFLLMTC